MQIVISECLDLPEALRIWSCSQSGCQSAKAIMSKSSNRDENYWSGISILMHSDIMRYQPSIVSKNTRLWLARSPYFLDSASSVEIERGGGKEDEERIKWPGIMKPTIGVRHKNVKKHRDSGHKGCYIAHTVSKPCFGGHVWFGQRAFLTGPRCDCRLSPTSTGISFSRATQTNPRYFHSGQSLTTQPPSFSSSMFIWTWPEWRVHGYGGSAIFRPGPDGAGSYPMTTQEKTKEKELGLTKGEKGTTARILPVINPILCRSELLTRAFYYFPPLFANAHTNIPKALLHSLRNNAVI